MPSCPKCGSGMKLRTARQGSRSGKKFYGCSTYPRCNGIINYSSSSKSSKPRKAVARTRGDVTPNIGKETKAVTIPRVVDPILRSRIEKAVKNWVASLVDFSRNNNLLFYRDTKTTTLDLTDANPEILGKLFSGEAVSLQELFQRLDLFGPEGKQPMNDVFLRAKKIRSRARENFEERSIGTLSLVKGFATWDLPDSSNEGRGPRAPIFIYGLEFRPGRKRDDITIALTGEPELNPVLQMYLKREYGIDTVLPDIEVAGGVDPIQAALRDFLLQWSEVPNLNIDEASTISNFSYAKLSMVQDLEEGIDELTSHELVLALSGDVKAQENVRNQVVDIDLGLPNLVAPQNEFLILDADSSQNEVINAISAGQSFAFEGPPGTGKSQTIANTISCLIAEGKKVLFVAEKRAAIDAVIRRLASVGLDQVVMDFHGSGKKRRDVLDELSQTLSSVSAVPLNVAEKSFDVLVRSRETLLGHNKALFDTCDPWGLSLFDVMAMGASVEHVGDIQSRIRPQDLSALTLDQLNKFEVKFESFERNGGFVGAVGADMWRNTRFDSQQSVLRAIDSLKDLVGDAFNRYIRANNEAHLLLGITTSNRSDQLAMVKLLAKIWNLQRMHRDDVFDKDLQNINALLSRKSSSLSRKIASIINRSFRREIRASKTFLKGAESVESICVLIAELSGIKTDWHKLCQPSVKVPIIDGSITLQELVRSSSQMDQIKIDLHPFTDLVLAIDANPDSVKSLANQLLEYELVGRGVLECRSLRDEFENVGLGQLIAEMQSRGGNLGQSGQVLRYVWAQSLSNLIRTMNPALSSSTRDSLDSAVRNFCAEDLLHISSNPEQILRLWARSFRDARQMHPKQEQALLAAINRKRNLHGLSRVFLESPDLISALKPCWVMSPLSVSMLRPPTGWFDVVIFDEASQIPPADAITSIKAAKQMVVAGDSLQLPPTAFFAAGETDVDDAYDDQAYEETSNSADYESILDFIKIIIPKYRQLNWHYRSRDERLIAYSNHKLYKTLISFPYSREGLTLEHVVVPSSKETVGKGASNVAEVKTVVDLVVRHAEQRANESLGVIALGIKHSDAIDDALASARTTNAALDAFLAKDEGGEPFFIKNLERVQGDERDCIILSVGYGRDEMGKVKYTFGPILGAKGERRLNVATTRAKLRMCTVATFGSSDLDIAKTSNGGAAFLREYLAYVETNGELFPDKGSTRVEMNPFEHSVFDQLSRNGVMLIPQYGVGNYRLDFAVQNPSKPGELVLAIECDGRSYHSFPTARDRDRLREAALRQRGWEFHRIWSDHWFANPQLEVAKALTSIQDAINRSNTSS